MKKIKTLVFLLLVFLCLFFTGYKVIDPDLGWHLRMGGIITTYGIPKTDPFSYSMPSYPFVDYEWLTNIIWYKTFPILGIAGWAVIYAGIVLFTMWVAIPGDRKKFAWLVMLPGWASMLFRFGMRAQVINWFFWAIVVRAMFDQKFWQKYKWFFPLLMLIWSNLHGSYPLGIVATAVFLGLKCLQERVLHKEEILIWLLGFGATFLNPYGWRNWAEVILVMRQSQLLRSTINEWAPFYNIVDFGFIFGLVFVIGDGWIFRRLRPWWYFAIGLWMLWWGVSGLRYIPIFMVFAAPGIANFLHDLHVLAKKNKEGEKRFEVFSRIVLYLMVTVFVTSAATTVMGGVWFKEEQMYPKQAIEFLQKNGYRRNLFSDYGWGGYLIWKMPADKYFIDGRMSCFSWKAPPGESDQALLDYQKILNSKEKLELAIEKYNINTVLWPKEGFYEGNNLEVRFDRWVKNILGIKEETVAMKINKFWGWLENLGWKKIYEDQLSVIYAKPVGR